MAFTSGAWSRPSTASLSPCTTFSTPFGRPASWNSSAISRVELGSRSEGLRMKVLPQAMASGYIHSGTIAGKLNGVIPATTPIGWKSLQASMFGPTLRLYSPLRISGAAQAYSTFSMPRLSSPAASSRVLPCSSLISLEIRASFCSSSCLKRYSTCARLAGGVLRQAGKAALAASMAFCRVLPSASGTLWMASPVEGLKTSALRPLSATISPLIRWWRVPILSCSLFARGDERAVALSLYPLPGERVRIT
ncbi:Uncharacterised protein [Pseudomonas fluorescens]|uniref:Uncharacterized protein n=1 Tax=Pseudomonas fluorescens TaxID=294 RepID=A0A448BVZ3_PSEFL|nr:Uncharacterised protein [Pseudomonas fluorescens]